MKYFARINKENVGPLSLSQLVEAGVRPSTYIWHKGLSEWQRADDDPDVCRAIRRHLAGLDPETGNPLYTPATAEKNTPTPEEQLKAMQEAAANGFLGLHALPEPPENTDYFSHKPTGVSVMIAIIATIVCFPFTGIAAIYFALRCSTHWKMSENPEISEEDRKKLQIKAHADARLYRMMIGITFCLGMIMAGFTLSRTLL